MARLGRVWFDLATALAIATAVVAMAACSSGGPKRQPTKPVVERDVAPVLRGTVGSMATFRRVEPVLVSGFGLVVGLPGTGGGTIPPGVAVTMEHELGRLGVSRTSRQFAGTPLAGLTPAEVVRHKDVAVVIVQAAIPVGSPEGATFDVLVRSLEVSGQVSLEGGYLWATDLSIGPPAVRGAIKTKTLARASGPVFINPFSEPGREGEGVKRTVGRVLDGGVVTSPEDVLLYLDNASHTQAAQVVTAIQTRFPDGPGREPTARGRSDQQVYLKVPHRYVDNPAEFIEIVKFLNPSALQFPQEFAKRYSDALKNETWLAWELSHCLIAIGEASIPFLRPLYEYFDPTTRLAALRAGAKLGDARAAPELKEMALHGPDTMRAEAITLLGELNAGPRVDLTLRELLAAPQLDVRVAAYEALAERAERVQYARLMREGVGTARGLDFEAISEIAEQRAQIGLPGATIQGVARQPVSGKFLLDQVPDGEPMVYVSQHGRPRITLFGDPKIVTPMLVSVWSDRLMLRSDGPSDELHIYYRDARTGKITRQRIKHDVVRLIEFMAHDPRPEDPRPGLGLTYSEVVGALAEIQKQGGIDASFATEQERLQAALLKATRGTTITHRAETDAAPPPGMESPMAPVDPTAPPTVPAVERSSIIVPLSPRPSKGR